MHEFSARVMAAETGRTHLFAVGQAGFILKSSSGQLLGIDLYLSDCVERLEGHKGYKRLLPRILDANELVFDVLICTHPHWDHFDVDSVPTLLANGRTKLFCSVDCEKLICQLRMEYHVQQITYVRPMDSFDVGDFHVDFVNCDHGSGAPDAVGVIVSVDGRRIYESGDTCLRLDRIEEVLPAPDVLIAPINGAYGNLDEKDCAVLAARLQPGITIPCHYGMFASHHGDVGAFYEEMNKRNLPVLLMRQGEGVRL